MGKFYFACIILLLIFSQRGNAQAPTFSYKTPVKLIVNVAAKNVTPTNTGGKIPNQIYSLASDVAGSGFYGNLDGPAEKARFENPIGLTRDAKGNIYVADANVNAIKKITPAGIVSTVAGGSKGARNGKGTNAQFNYPTGVAVDAAGNLYVADFLNSLIRKITPDGTVTTYAGNPKAAGRVDGVGTDASFNLPYGIAIDKNGDLYIADTYNSQIRRITTDRRVSTIAGTGAPGHNDGSALRSTFDVPYGVALDSDGNIFIADGHNGCIRKLSTTNEVTTFATGFLIPYGLAIDKLNNIYVSDQNAYNIIKLDPTTGKPTTKFAFSGGTYKTYLNSTDTLTRYTGFMGLAYDGSDNILISEPGTDRIRKVATTGYTVSPRLPKGLSINGSGAIVGTPVSISAAKNYTITGYNNYGKFSTKINLAVEVGSQTITYKKTPAITYGNADLDSVAISTNSTIPIVYKSDNTKIITVVNGKLHIVGSGKAVITANQAANKNYTSAKQVSKTFTVNKATLTITAANYTKATGEINPKFTVSYQGFVNGEDETVVDKKPGITTTATDKSPVGIYPITAAGSTDNNYKFIYIAGSLTVIPVPVITATGSTNIVEGGFVTLTASPTTGYPVQWYLNGVAIKGATTNTYKATETGGYSVSITKNFYNAYSLYTSVTAQLVLPADNFKLQLTSITCKGSNNGIVDIKTAKTLKYNAVIFGNNLNKPYDFTNELKVDNLSPGSYSICITVKGKVFSRCFEVNVTEPQDLAVYSTVNNTAKTVNLQLDGGSIYSITLNNVNYTTTKSEITLPLLAGSNKLKVTTDRLCQGIVEKNIEVPGDIIPYPNPFHDVVNINVGNVNINQALISVISISSGKTVYTTQYQNVSGVLQLDLSTLPSGLYYLNLDLDNKKSGYKIIKK